MSEMQRAFSCLNSRNYGVGLGLIIWVVFLERKIIEHSWCSLLIWNLGIYWTKSSPQTYQVQKISSEYWQKSKALSTHCDIEPFKNRNNNSIWVWCLVWYFTFTAFPNCHSYWSLRRLLHDDIREQSWAREITETFVEKENGNRIYSIIHSSVDLQRAISGRNSIEILSMISLSLAAINAEEQEDKCENLTLIISPLRCRQPGWI